MDANPERNNISREQQPNQAAQQEPLLLGRYRTSRMIYQGKTSQTFWWVGSVASLILNGVLIAIVILLIGRIRELQELQNAGLDFANKLLSEAYVNFMLMEDANIVTTVIVEDTIPVQFDLNVKTDTTVTLTEPTLIRGATTDLRTGGLNINNAPTDIVLPAGTQLPISLEIVVPVDKTVPVQLEVPVNIPLKQTDLVTPFQGLQKLLYPYLPVESRQYLCDQGRGFDCGTPTPVKTFP